MKIDHLGIDLYSFYRRIYLFQSCVDESLMTYALVLNLADDIKLSDQSQAERFQ